MLLINAAFGSFFAFSGLITKGWLDSIAPILPMILIIVLVVEIVLFATFSIHGLRLRFDNINREKELLLAIKARKLEAQRLANIKKQMTPAERALYEVQLENNKLLNDIKNKPSPQSSQWVRGVTYEIGDN